MRSIILVLLLIGCNSKQSGGGVAYSDAPVFTGSEAQVNLMRAIDSMIDTTDFYTISDSAREIVSQNTIHDERPFLYAVEDIDSLANALRDSIELGVVPVFYCGHRAQMVRLIMEYYGHKTRLVNVLTSKYSDVLNGHVFMEVLSPEDKWQAIDADFDTYYMLNGQRVGVNELLFQDPLPCNSNGCSWSNISHDGWAPQWLKDEGMFGAAYVSDTGSVIINTEKFNTRQTFSGMTVWQIYRKIILR